MVSTTTAFSCDASVRLRKMPGCATMSQLTISNSSRSSAPTVRARQCKLTMLLVLSKSGFSSTDAPSRVAHAESRSCLCPVITTTSDAGTPFAARLSIWSSRRDRPPSSSNAFGRSFVSGSNRLPTPAARIATFRTGF